MVGFGHRLLPGCFAAAVLLAACGAPNSTSSGRGRSAELTPEELQEYSTVLDAVQALRAGWLRMRTPLVLAPGTGTAPANPVWVYWDGTRVGDASYLGRLSPSQVSRVIRYDARAASVRWGIGHENGAIYVVPAVGAAGPMFE